jgi:hypothetical protein
MNGFFGLRGKSNELGRSISKILMKMFVNLLWSIEEIALENLENGARSVLRLLAYRIYFDLGKGGLGKDFEEFLGKLGRSGNFWVFR